MAEEARKVVRSRYCGLRDVYAAIIKSNEETEFTTDTPVKLARAISAKISDKWSSEKIYSDDGTEDSISSYEGTEVEFEIASLAPQDRAMLFGHKYENGFLVESKNDEAPELAFGYRTKRRNGKYEFVWLYCGKFGDGNDDEHDTLGEKIETKTNTIKGTFYDRKLDGQYKISVDESNLIDTDTDAKTAITNWFAKVQEKEQAAG